MKLFLASLMVLALFAAPAFAQAATPADFNAQPYIVLLIPYIADIVWAILGVAALWLVKIIRDKLHIDLTTQLTTIEANNRDALHSAVVTALGKAVAKYGANLDFTVGSPAASLITSIVKASVPEAVDLLKATDQWILTAAESKLALAPVAVAGLPPIGQTAPAAAG